MRYVRCLNLVTATAFEPYLNWWRYAKPNQKHNGIWHKPGNTCCRPAPAGLFKRLSPGTGSAPNPAAARATVITIKKATAFAMTLIFISRR